MTTFKRYAIYYAPSPGALAEFGAAWLGWNLETGTACQHPDMPGLDVESLTRTPRKYGLHGTVKPPFFLAEGTDFKELSDATQALCADQPRVRLDGLALTRIGGFLALTPLGETAALGGLAAAVVAGLDRFRAPASEAELARRRQARLTDRQEALLTRWGYPYVMEEFRFHITLTGRVPKEEIQALTGRLEPVFTPLLPAPFVISDLCLVGEDGDGKFHLIRRLPLLG